MTIASASLAALAERGWTLGVAESLTGGSVASALVAVPGASAVLLGAVVAYATPVKHSLLGVDEVLLRTRGPVQPDVALQMADGVRAAVRVDERPADVGIATTGIAGPDSPDGQPVGTVHIAVVTPTSTQCRSFVFAGGRDEIRAQATDAVLTLLDSSVRE
nr:CinA family protein [Microbacterium hydrocarbonoxydans]